MGTKRFSRRKIYRYIKDKMLGGAADNPTETTESSRPGIVSGTIEAAKTSFNDFFGEKQKEPVDNQEEPVDNQEEEPVTAPLFQKEEPATEPLFDDDLVDIKEQIRDDEKEIEDLKKQLRDAEERLIEDQKKLIQQLETTPSATFNNDSFSTTEGGQEALEAPVVPISTTETMEEKEIPAEPVPENAPLPEVTDNVKPKPAGLPPLTEMTGGKSRRNKRRRTIRKSKSRRRVRFYG